VREEIRALQAYHVVPAEGSSSSTRWRTRIGARAARRPDGDEARVGRGEPLSGSDRERAQGAAARSDGHSRIAGDLLGNGSDEILQIIALALARPGAVALAPEPGFAMYRISAIAAGMRYVGVPLAADFSLDEQAFCERSRRTGRLSPGSPIRTTPAETCSRARPSRAFSKPRPGSSSSTRPTIRSPAGAT
jgi:histidinol-phosphate aminotransferase